MMDGHHLRMRYQDKLMVWLSFPMFSTHLEVPLGVFSRLMTMTLTLSTDLTVEWMNGHWLLRLTIMK
jgi:hypothetical protein